MRKTLISQVLILIALFVATAASSAAQMPTTDSADATRTTQPAQSGDVCERRLEKVLADLDAADRLIAALRAEIESRKTKELIDRGVIEAQEKLIALYEKRRGTKISLLFGLITVRKN